jgi:hypothetical protein
MKRALMMLVAVLAMATVASVQAADVKIEIKERDAKQNLVPAQNIKYAVANADGDVVANGEKSEFTMDVPEGNYSITVEQSVANNHVRYGATTFDVPAEGDDYVFVLTDDGLKLVEEDDDKAAVVLPGKPVANVAVHNVVNLPQIPTQLPTTGAVYAGNNWGVLGLAGALVATAIALGVDDNDCPCPVTPCQR